MRVHRVLEHLLGRAFLGHDAAVEQTHPVRDLAAKPISCHSPTPMASSSSVTAAMD